jgi:hypothetical protein
MTFVETARWYQRRGTLGKCTIARSSKQSEPPDVARKLTRRGGIPFRRSNGRAPFSQHAFRTSSTWVGNDHQSPATSHGWNRRLHSLHTLTRARMLAWAISQTPVVTWQENCARHLGTHWHLVSRCNGPFPFACCSCGLFVLPLFPPALHYTGSSHLRESDRRSLQFRRSRASSL